ncbi:MAG: hypothetical protein KDK37_00295 [Leptospiraceae bacterium]|nr:hypothetical protein [Leptospiraceae bacterium]MCB1302681.1 hypothetical protein [Leptospiraceae bacterium]
MQRLIAFLEYDEVTLFCLNYSFLLMLLMDWQLAKSFSLYVLLNPVTIIYGLSVLSGIYLSIKHIWIEAPKSTREVFFMVGGGGWLAISTAFFSLRATPSHDYVALALSGYSFLYNFLILWFLGLGKGLEVAHLFMSSREVHKIEAILSALLVTALAGFLYLYLDWSWWKTVSGCVFYALGANKLLLGIMHRRKSSTA